MERVILSDEKVPPFNELQNIVHYYTYYLRTVTSAYIIYHIKAFKTKCNSHNAANVVCCLFGWVQQLNIDWEIHQQRASNDKVVELWTRHSHNTAKGRLRGNQLPHITCSNLLHHIQQPLLVLWLLIKGGIYSCADIVQQTAMASYLCLGDATIAIIV